MPHWHDGEEGRRIIALDAIEEEALLLILFKKKDFQKGTEWFLFWKLGGSLNVWENPYLTYIPTDDS